MPSVSLAGAGIGTCSGASRFRPRLRRWCRHELVEEFADPAGTVLVDPVDDVPVGREQPQAPIVLDGLQRTNPGVERLLRELRFEAAETLMPERNLHDRRAFDRDGERGETGKGGECIPPSGPVDISCFTVDSRPLATYPCPPFYDQPMSLFLVLFRGQRSRTMKRTYQPEQSAPQASPRFPCAHGHQGRSSRAEPPPREGPQAPRGLIVPTTRPDRSPAAPHFPRASRLTDKPQFDAVHRQGQRSSDALFMVITRPNEAGRARLGLAVGVKAAGNAVQRNRIKRLVRESFRHRQQDLPPVDLVVNARTAAAKATERRDPREPGSPLG